MWSVKVEGVSVASKGSWEWSMSVRCSVSG